jgi:hypothetical protein
MTCKTKQKRQSQRDRQSLAWKQVVCSCVKPSFANMKQSEIEDYFEVPFFFFKKKKPEKQSEKDLIRLVFKKRLCKQKQDIVKVFSAKRFAFCIFSFVNGNNCSFKKQKFKKKNLHFESKKGYRRNRQVLLLLKGREG